MADAEVEIAIRRVWSFESAKLVGRLMRMVDDLALAGRLTQEALDAALEAWPRAGMPPDAAAWLMTTAKDRALAARPDAATADDVDRTAAPFGGAVGRGQAPSDELGDDVLRLVFLVCHPSLPAESRAALALRLVNGLSLEDIGRGVQAAEADIAGLVAQATEALAAARVPFEVPRGSELEERLAAVLEVVYLIFNEGLAATPDDDPQRAAMTQEGLRLGLIVAQLLPREPEPHGLVSLMAFHLSRAAARHAADGRPIQLLEQDRAQWDAEMIRRGLAALEKAELAGPRGGYTTQAAIAACHARAKTPDDTEWPRIAMLYGKLGELVRSPGVELNRAVAVAMAYGPAKGLEIIDALAAAPELAAYHPIPSARAYLLAKLGRFGEARAEFERAAQLAEDPREQAHLRATAAACPPGDAAP